MPSRTGMPARPELRGERLGRWPTRGWTARRPACRCARPAGPIALGNDSSPSNSGTRSTASATTSTASSSASAARHRRAAVLGAVAGAPDVERVRGIEARVEQRRTAASTVASDERRERDAEPLGHVGRPAPARPRSRGRWRCRRRGRRTRRPIAKHSRLSVSSPRSSARCTPYAANSASQPASDPAIAPEWASTRACPRAEPPTVDRDHGDVALGGVGQAGRAGRGASRRVSSTSPITRVSGRDRAYAR